MKKSPLCLIIAFIITNCSSTVMVTSKPSGAKVTVGGQQVGNTPASVERSNLAWTDHPIQITKKGYEPYSGSIQKEAKAVPLIVGFLVCCPAMLWGYGPKEQFYVELSKTEKTDSKGKKTTKDDDDE